MTCGNDSHDFGMPPSKNAPYAVFVNNVESSRQEAQQQHDDMPSASSPRIVLSLFPSSCRLSGVLDDVLR
jgi:hypothetical protein